MAVETFSAEEIALLVSDVVCEDEESSDDEYAGDFTTSDGQTFVLSSESLYHSSRMTSSMPFPSEMDSLLLCETSDFDTANDDRSETGGDEIIDEDDGAACRNDGNSETVDSSNEADDSRDWEFEYKWCDVEENFAEPDLPDFCEPVGVSGEARSAKSPFECFTLFFTSAVISILVTQTNLYASQLRSAKVPSPSNRWEDVTTDEMLAYLGLHIAMGIVNLPNIKDFWSTEPILQHQWFGSIMCRDRFKQILRYFHCADQTGYIPHGQDGHDPLYKLRDIIDILSERFELLYNPNRELSIDESMIGTKCRVPFLQYMPKKPTKWGIKVWVCADAKTAYATRFIIYTGKDNDDNSGKRLGYRVVMKLLQPYLGKHYKVYFDNFYTSPELCSDLLKKKTYSSGTVRTNREHFPKDIGPNLKVSPGSIHFQACGPLFTPLTAVRFSDKRDVWLLSTICGTTTELTKRQRKGGKGGQEAILIPKIINDYNNFMGRVDVVDQHFVYYAIGRRGVKWWRRVFYRLLEMAIVNAYTVYKINNPEISDKATHKSFRLQLVHSLCEPLLSSRIDPEDSHQSFRGRKPIKGNICLHGKHFLYNSGTRARCRVCAKQVKSNGKHKDTKVRTYCPKCEVHLCIGKCFEIYHTKCIF